MIKFIRYYIYIISLLLVACNAPTYFLPASVGNDVAYLPKPMHSDSVKAKSYISASYADLDLPYGSGQLSMGFLNVSRGITTKSLNIGYGAFGYAGRTHLSNKDHQNAVAEFNDKTFLGGGLRTSLSFYDISGSTEFRMLGWENALSFENGSYADFRKKINLINNPDTIASRLTTIYTTGITSEIIFHSRRNLSNQFGFKLFYGFSPKLSNSLANEINPPENGAAVDFSFYFKTRRFFGIYNVGGNKGYSSKFTLGLSF